MIPIGGIMQVDLEFTQFVHRGDFVERLSKAAIATGLSPAATEILVAQAAHETGWGKGGGSYPDQCTGMPNNNAFGIKVSQSWIAANKPYAVVSTREYQNGEYVLVPKERFRAWPTLEEGVQGAVDFLDQRLYQRPLALLRAGDEGFFRALGETEPAYYTAPIEAYTRSSKERLTIVRRMIDVLKWQRALLADDIDCLPKCGADGLAGKELSAALRAYQERHDLPVTGERDQDTAICLFAKR
jgi:peptidoglycan hydrolase-like protein with peptidoglycan-binding domain